MQHLHGMLDAGLKKLGEQYASMQYSKPAIFAIGMCYYIVIIYAKLLIA
jgi:hypothetical protein